ncbi:MAG TPA: metallopeptidase family protein [Ktedonobacterales bacterium]|jgi:predicted Zn-dependent protease with MMP-like domain|nr:metallopeptidase family protein [Ktedonobacterales bacterium]
MPDERAQTGAAAHNEPDCVRDAADSLEPDGTAGATLPARAGECADRAARPDLTAGAAEREDHDDHEDREVHDEHVDHDPFAAAALALADHDPDYYAVLGLRPDASATEIRQSYHRLAKLWHPDRFMAAPPPLRTRAERRMRALVDAYRVLGNGTRRQAYDRRSESDGQAAWSGAEPMRPIWMGADTSFPFSPPRAYGYTPGAKPGSPNGAGILLGALAGILALSILLRSFGGGGNDPGTYIGLVLAVALGALAIWCLVADSAPARLAQRWMESDPPVEGSDLADLAGVTHPSASAAEDPADLDDARFEQLVEQAVASIPAEFQAAMTNVVVRVKTTPSAEELERMSIRENGLLLGLYEGVELTDQGAAGAGPEVITIFREPIERYCHDDPDRIREQLRRTVLHEVAHHFGIDHEDMPHWVR